MTPLVLAIVFAALAGWTAFTGVSEPRPKGLQGEWLTVDEAARRTGLSAAIWRQYARNWEKLHLARKVTRNVGKVRSEWLIHASADPRLTAAQFESACRVDLTRTPPRYAAWALDDWRWVARFRALLAAGRRRGLSTSAVYRQVITEARQEGRKLSRRSLEVYTRALLGPDGRGVTGLIPGYQAARLPEPGECEERGRRTGQREGSLRRRPSGA